MSGEIDTNEEVAALEQDQTFLALVVLRDPVRSSVKEIVKESEESGVNLHLVSGDNLSTACKLAHDIGMLTHEEYESTKSKDSHERVAMDASEFRELVGDVIKTTDVVEEGLEQTFTYELETHRQERFNFIVNSLKVIGRAEPEDKLRLVVALQNANDPNESGMARKVAIVGEGISDCAAFDAADVSFACQSGTSYARNKASMILRTNDFDSCIQAVKWGRNIYMNVRRFLQFQITCNLCLVVVMIVSYCTMTEGALNATQLIYINLIMDIFGALALASTRPGTTTERYNNSSQVMTSAMYRQIFGTSLFMIAIMMVIMFAGKSIFNLNYFASTQTIDLDIFGLGKAKMEHFTLIWNTFVFLQVFNLINCRDVSSSGRNGFSGLHRNFLTVFIILLIVGVQFLSCFTFLGRIFFEASYTGAREWMVCVVAASSVLLANALLKFVPESIFAKAQLNEKEPIGQNSRILAAYNTGAKGKAFKPKAIAEGSYEPPVSQ